MLLKTCKEILLKEMRVKIKLMNTYLKHNVKNY